MRSRIEMLSDWLLSRVVPSVKACACRCYTQIDNAGCRHRQCCTCTSGTVCDPWRPGC
jgi:hypothetical protein